jgi:hypothetical protein
LHRLWPRAGIHSRDPDARVVHDRILEERRNGHECIAGGGPECAPHRELVEDLQSLITAQAAHGHVKLAKVIQELIEALQSLLGRARADGITGPMQRIESAANAHRPLARRAAARLNVRRRSGELRAQFACGVQARRVPRGGLRGEECQERR